MSEASKPTISPMGTALVAAITAAAEASIYLPVERVSGAGNRRAPDAMAAIPIPLWERVVEACDQFNEEADERYL